LLRIGMEVEAPCAAIPPFPSKRSEYASSLQMCKAECDADAMSCRGHGGAPAVFLTQN